MFLLGYATLLLDDAKTYSNFAKKKNVDVDDVKIAIQLAQDGVFIKPPPREVNNFLQLFKFIYFYFVIINYYL